MSDDPKFRAAEAAMAEVRPGMRLGLGTGSTARHFVDLIGRAVAEGLDVLCIPTSEATHAQAAALGIPLTDLETTPQLDLTVDGADEIGPGLGATTIAIERLMRDFGAEGPLARRLRPDGSAFMTDGGHAILDASFGRIPDPEAVAAALIQIPGVVEHGLFIGLCQRAYVAGTSGVDVLDG